MDNTIISIVGPAELDEMQKNPRRRRNGSIALAALLCVLGSDRAMSISPAEAEHRTVSAVDHSQMAIVVNESMVFLDEPLSDVATRGIRLPVGKYNVEAEDANYLYARSPEPVEYRILRAGVVVGDRFMPGGIYISKGGPSATPAGVYMTQDAEHKILTWRLGTEFIQFEGSKWLRELNPP